MIYSAVGLLERAAVKFADNIAVEHDEKQITYKEYRLISRKIGSALIKEQMNRQPVIVYLPKSIMAITSFMGAMYAGCPYAPVDSHIPMERLKKIIDSLKPAAIITDDLLKQNLNSLNLGETKVLIYNELEKCQIDDNAIEKSLLSVISTDPIYIIYTSGSTGTPKGVTIAHCGITDYAQWLIDTFNFDSQTVMASQAPFYFDNSTFDIYGSLKCGGKLVLIPDNLLLFPNKLPQFLKEKEITSIFWVPTVMINVANSGALDGIELPKLKNIAFAGEVMPNTQLNIWRKHLPNCSYANLYGPTEITDVCCYYIVDREFKDNEPLPLGKACENMKVIILNDENKEVKIGEKGELCVIGSGVAIGYWNSPEITEKAFVYNPLSTNYREIMYRTGDLASYDENGLIMFHGRRDNQVKIKGNRIELGEIEKAAMCIDGVENAAAIFDQPNERIVLFVEAVQTLPFRRFNMALKNYIPQYMLPAKLVVMDKLPHTANDKIDRIALKNTL